MKNYIVKVAEKTEHKFNCLKDARNFIRSMINVNEVKGIKEKFEIFKEVTKRHKIDEAISNPNNSGKFDKVFG